jgi:hypothetical protein
MRPLRTIHDLMWPVGSTLSHPFLWTWNACSVPKGFINWKFGKHHTPNANLAYRLVIDFLHPAHLARRSSGNGARSVPCWHGRLASRLGCLESETLWQWTAYQLRAFDSFWAALPKGIQIGDTNYVLAQVWLQKPYDHTMDYRISACGCKRHVIFPWRQRSRTYSWFRLL